MAERKIWLLALLTISIFIFTQCTSRYSQTEVDQILTPERASAKTSPISFRIPQNWRVIDANDSTFIDLWLISDDYKYSLSLIPLHGNNSVQNFSHWIRVSKLSNNMRFENDKIEIIDEEPVEINRIHCEFYRFINNDSFYRVSIFEFKEKFYELTLLEKELNNYSSSQLDFLIQLQNALIVSIK